MTNPECEQTARQLMIDTIGLLVYAKDAGDTTLEKIIEKLRKAQLCLEKDMTKKGIQF